MKLGVTGHQRLDDSTAWDWVGTRIVQELKTVPPPFTVVSALAIGADQFVSKVILDEGGTLYVVLPFAGIERTFEASDVQGFRALLERAEVETLSTSGTDEDSYLAAGKRVVDLCDRLFAVWDGQPAKGKGGTGDIVAYAISQKKPIVHFNPLMRTVTHINLPTAGR